MGSPGLHSLCNRGEGCQSQGASSQHGFTSLAGGFKTEHSTECKKCIILNHEHTKLCSGEPARMCPLEGQAACVVCEF